MSIQISIIINGDKIEVRGPYSSNNNDEWRKLGGRWSQDRWAIPDTDTARAKIVEMFGERGDDVEVVIPASECWESGGIAQYKGYVVANRKYRDSRVEMPHGVSLHTGSFSSSGGSVKHPRVGLTEDMSFRVTVRKPFAVAHNLQSPISAPEAERLSV